MSLSLGSRQWVISTLLLISTANLFGQATTSLSGRVVDPTGASVPEPVITITLDSQGFNRKTVGDATGFYQFLQLPPGNYIVKVEKTGFATLLQKNVLLQVNLPATVELKMEVGNVSQTIAVEAEAPPINTQDASIGNAFNQTQVRQLPLLTRNVVELLSLQAGVTATGEVLGARRDQNNVTLDGADVNDNQSAGAFTAVLPVPLDSVQEFRVTVGGQGANMGRSSGGQVSLVTKSGSNQFHGSLYEFHRNTVTSANNWFSNRAGIKREALIRNQFGGSIGGRIIKDRAFFFFNYEDRIDASGAAQTRTVPSESLKNGILTLQTSDGVTRQLSQAEMATVIDPQRRGFSPFVKDLLAKYPVGNDPALGSDGGLNFSGLRFNAPFKLNNRAYVARMDFRIDKEGKHNAYIRGTLADNKEDNSAALAQFPGQPAASLLLNNSRGFTANYTGVLKSNLTHSASLSLTRQGLEQSGATGPRLSLSGISDQINYTRGNGRILPVWQLIDDLTWMKGKHTIQTGINFRFIRNDRFNFAPSFPTFGMSRGTMLGLGSDITTAVLDHVKRRDGLPATTGLRNSVPLVNAVGAYLGMITNLDVTFQFDRDGKALPVGAAQARSFKTNEYEFYVQDAWRVTRDLNLTFGLRYGSYSVPYEANGLQVNTTTPLDSYFAQRVGLGAQGVAGNAMPDALLKYALAGPANNAKDWYARDKNNFAPRFSFAYSKTGATNWLTKSIFGNGGVIRGGAAMVYDRFGSDLIVNFDQLGSVGLASRAGFPLSYNMTTAPRLTTAGAFPALPAAPTGGFPFTPPDVFAVAGTGLGMFSDLKTPYSMLLNLNYAREIKGGQTFEFGYVGRLSRKTLIQGDIFTPLTGYKDTKSGQTWLQMATRTRDLFEGGLTPAAVQRNPNSITPIPFIENVFPGLKDYYFPGSATANYFNHIYAENDGSDMDGLHLLDRVTGFGGGKCLSAPGCHTFFSRQGSALPTWMNAGIANYHGMTLAVRRQLKKGFGYDFNYTLSHSIDNGSAAESGAGQFGGTLQNVYNVGAFRGSSDFDIRHNINANAVYELPFGRGQKFLNTNSSALNQLVGGWSITTIMRFRTGLPSTIGGSGVWNSNYWLSSLAIPKADFTNKIGINEKGQPALFPATSAVNSFMDQYPGQTGARAIVRLDQLQNWDIAASKRFFMPFEGHTLQFRAEAFNAFNQHFFSDQSLAISSPATFGQFRAASAPRVFQFALRYEF
ncbi:MAG: TonB-dependent receptor [Acidobacteria bacterium]|nr:TonB-dependent receptor [Acidobacteriota bacterium]